MKKEFHFTGKNIVIIVAILTALVFIVGFKPHYQEPVTPTDPDTFSNDSVIQSIIEKYNEISDNPITKDEVEVGKYEFSSIITQGDLSITIRHGSSFTSIFIRCPDDEKEILYPVMRDLILSECPKATEKECQANFKKLSTMKYFRNVDPKTRIESDSGYWATLINRNNGGFKNTLELELRLMDVK